MYPVKLFYGLGSISGFTAQDTISINQQQSVYPFKFLAVHEAKNLKTLHADGIVGLSPQKPDDRSELRFLDQMKQNRIIDRRVFSFYIDASRASGSKLTLGHYDLNKYADLDNDSLYWHKSVDDRYWSAQLA